ncbi:MAG: ATP-binding protein, partial [Chloroflexota bacterium]
LLSSPRFAAEPGFVAAALRGVPGVGQARPARIPGIAVVPLWVPIRLGGHVVGVLQGSLSLSKLTREINTVQVGEKGHATLYDSGGTVLADPTVSRILSTASTTDRATRQAEHGIEATAVTTSSLGQRIFVAAVPVASLGWIAEVQLPAAEVLAPSNLLVQRAIQLAVLSFLLATALGAIVAQRLVRPIELVRGAARRMALGDYTPPKLDIRTHDEMEDLARDVTTLAANLRSAVADLQAQVDRADMASGEMRSVLDATGEGMIFVTGEGRLGRINGRAAEMFGLPPEEVLGTESEELLERMREVFDGSEAFFVDLARRLADHGTGASFTLELSQQHPRRRDIELFSTPVDSPAAHRLGRLHVFRDVTHQREVERLKSEFVALVSHELRTPLTSVAGYVDLLLDGEAGPLSEAQRSCLTIVRKNSDRLAALISDLLDLSRIESGRLELHLEPLQLPLLAAQAVQIVRPLTEQKKQRLELSFAPNCPAVLADGNRVEQVLTNLLSNASKYTQEGGQIWLSGALVDGLARVDVRDTGVGLSEEELGHLFTRFYRAHNPAARQAGGSGLGLSIARSLVEMQGGHMSVSSTPGQGSTFSFTLPLAPAPVG